MPAARNSSSVTTDDTTACDQTWNLSWSAAGTPSSSQITVIGSGNAKASMRSTDSSPPAKRPSIASSSDAVISSIRGRSPAIRRAVNALTTRRRSRVWSGGSRLSRCLLR